MPARQQPNGWPEGGGYGQVTAFLAKSVAYVIDLGGTSCSAFMPTGIFGPRTGTDEFSVDAKASSVHLAAVHSRKSRSSVVALAPIAHNASPKFMIIPKTLFAGITYL